METTQTLPSHDRRTPPASLHEWTIDPSHTSVTFGVRHMMVATVRGEFQKVSGAVLWDPSRPDATSIEASIDVASISTREPARDAHLRSADFFDVERHPTIEFRSRGVGRRKDGVIEVIGDLTIRGTTRVIALEIEGPTEEHPDSEGNVRLGASASTRIKRSDFGITWNTVLETGGVLVGDEIKIQIDVELVRSK